MHAQDHKLCKAKESSISEYNVAHFIPLITAPRTTRSNTSSCLHLVNHKLVSEKLKNSFLKSNTVNKKPNKESLNKEYIVTKEDNNKNVDPVVVKIVKRTTNNCILNKEGEMEVLYKEVIQELNMREEQSNKENKALRDTINMLTIKLVQTENEKTELEKKYECEVIKSNEMKECINILTPKFNTIEQKNVTSNKIEECEKEEYKRKYLEKCEELKNVKVKAEKLKQIFEKYTTKKQEQEMKIKMLEVELTKYKEEVNDLTNELTKANLNIKSLEDVNLLLIENPLKHKHCSEDNNSIEETFCSDRIEKEGSEMKASVLRENNVLISKEGVENNIVDNRLDRELILRNQNYKLYKEVVLLKKALMQRDVNVINY